MCSLNPVIIVKGYSNSEFEYYSDSFFDTLRISGLHILTARKELLLQSQTNYRHRNVEDQKLFFLVWH
jgi:hypothetical protein